MSDTKTLLQTFNQWIDTLPEDARALQQAAFAKGVPRPAQRLLIGSLDYLPRRFDLIPDHIAEIGTLDDAFVLRVGAMLAAMDGLGDLGVDHELKVRRLAEQADVLKEFLGDAYPLLVAYVARLPDVHVRNRDADRVLDEEEIRDLFLRELRDDLAGHQGGTLKSEAALDQARLFIKDKCNLALAR